MLLTISISGRSNSHKDKHLVSVTVVKKMERIYIYIFFLSQPYVIKGRHVVYVLCCDTSKNNGFNSWKEKSLLAEENSGLVRR